MLTRWAGWYASLREVTRRDILDAIDARHRPVIQHRIVALHSLFLALRQERAIFLDPTRGISLSAAARLPASRVAGLLDRATVQQRRLGVAPVLGWVINSEQEIPPEVWPYHRAMCIPPRNLKIERMRRPRGPFAWGMLYLVMILVFAVIYSNTANSFYETTATHEPFYLDNQTYVAQAIADAVGRDIESQAEQDNIRPGNSGGAYYLRATANETDILATVGFTTNSKSGDVAVQIDIPEYNIPSAANAVDGLAFLHYSLGSTTHMDVESGRGPGSQLFKEYTDSDVDHTLPVTLVELIHVQQFSDAAQGLVGGLPDQFSRMLYFSAVTATTLGFGDIAPVTFVSRSLVTAEAVLEVVIIGMFLNSLARRRSDEKGVT